MNQNLNLNRKTKGVLFGQNKREPNNHTNRKRKKQLAQAKIAPESAQAASASRPAVSRLLYNQNQSLSYNTHESRQQRIYFALPSRSMMCNKPAHFTCWPFAQFSIILYFRIYLLFMFLCFFFFVWSFSLPFLQVKCHI